MQQNAELTPDAARRATGFATRFGGEAVESPYGLQAVFAPRTAQEIADGFVAPLTDLGQLEVTGDDAAKFLHAQLSNDVEHLGAVEARLYGYCSPKGRMLASFVGWREPQGFALAISNTLTEAIRKRLSMFVLRSKARIADRSDSIVLLGVGGERATAALESIGIAAPAAMQVARVDDLACVGMPPVRIAQRACPRWLISVPESRADAVWSALRDRLSPASTGIWRWTDVLAGVPRIVAATGEAFVPQMVNFELVGGVSFTKGCYPGQEIVARSHYLGKLKRRMFAGHLAEAAEPAPGADVLPAGGGDPCGQVVLAAASPEGGVDLLFESQIAALAAGPPAVGPAPIAVVELPYALPA